MSISASVGVQIPTNVVEVGNEITSDQLGAITSASSPSAANPFLTLAGGTLTGAVSVPQINNNLNVDLVIDSYNDSGAGTHYLHKFTPYDGKFNLATNGGGLVFPDATVQTTAGYPNTNPNGYVSTSGIGADQAYAIALTSNIQSFTWNSFNWGGSIAHETPYFSANKTSLFKFYLNNQYEFTPSWSGSAFSLSGISDDTTYTTTGSGESFTVKWNGVNGTIAVI